MANDLHGDLDASALRLAIVASHFNEDITDRLLNSGKQTWAELGGEDDRLIVAHVPGALELPVIARHLAEAGRVDAVVCYGCVIRGQTGHYDVVVEGTRQGLVDVAVATGIPVIFGVLTVENHEQALDRTDAGRKVDLGADAVRTAVRMARLIEQIDELA
jgi:6,7-dimethyl-8-ribityllumazine synthase